MLHPQISYRPGIGYISSNFFHGREPKNRLDLGCCSSLIERLSVNSEYIIALQDTLLQNFPAFEAQHNFRVSQKSPVLQINDAAKTLAVKTSSLP